MLLAAAGLAASQVVGASAQPTTAQDSVGRRRLGSLEVSAIGLGVQNMSRIYQTTIPRRPKMLRIIRAANELGLAFFDAAEAYGPHEVERILGEGIAPFRDRVVITSKFGWNIDLETGERRPGLNSRPDHIKLAVAGMLRRLKTDRPARRRSGGAVGEAGERAVEYALARRVLFSSTLSDLILGAVFGHPLLGFVR